MGGNSRSIKQRILPRVNFRSQPTTFLSMETGNNRASFEFENWWLGVEGFNDQLLRSLDGLDNQRILSLTEEKIVLQIHYIFYRGLC